MQCTFQGLGLLFRYQRNLSEFSSNWLLTLQSANPEKWSGTLKQFVNNSGRIV